MQPLSTTSIFGTAVRSWREMTLLRYCCLLQVLYYVDWTSKINPCLPVYSHNIRTADAKLVPPLFHTSKMDIIPIASVRKNNVVPVWSTWCTKYHEWLSEL